MTDCRSTCPIGWSKTEIHPERQRGHELRKAQLGRQGCDERGARASLATMQHGRTACRAMAASRSLQGLRVRMDRSSTSPSPRSG